MLLNRPTRALLCWAVLVAAMTPARAINFAKVVDTSSTLPGITGTFTVPLQNASYRNGRAAFVVGEPSGIVSIYRWDHGIFTRIADTSTLNPATNLAIGAMRGAPSIDENGNIAFYIQDSSSLCVWTSGTLAVYPGLGAPLINPYAMPDMRQGKAYAASTGMIAVGDTASSSVVVDANIKPPGSPVSVTNFGSFAPLVLYTSHVDQKDGVMYFRGSSMPGIYTSTTLALGLVADTATTVPGKGYTFLDFRFPVSWQHGAVFRGIASVLVEGVYAQNALGQLFTVADANTTSTEAPTAMSDFQDVASNGPWIAFSDKLETRIHLWDGTTIRKVVQFGDVIDGKTVSLLTLTPQSMDGSELLCYLNNGWYLASNLTGPTASVQDWTLY